MASSAVPIAAKAAKKTASINPVVLVGVGLVVYIGAARLFGGVADVVGDVVGGVKGAAGAVGGAARAVGEVTVDAASNVGGATADFFTGYWEGPSAEPEPITSLFGMQPMDFDIAELERNPRAFEDTTTAYDIGVIMGTPVISVTGGEQLIDEIPVTGILKSAKQNLIDDSWSDIKSLVGSVF